VSQRPDPAVVASRALEGATSPRATGHMSKWTAGAPPGPAFIIADGLGSQSTRRGKLEPWLTILKPTIQNAKPGAEVRGFSYFYPGHRYYGEHTNRSILTFSYELFDPYGPPPDCPISYVAFSLAGPVLSLGLHGWLVKRQQVSAATVKDFILVQPAFRLTRQVAASLTPYLRTR